MATRKKKKSVEGSAATLPKLPELPKAPAGIGARAVRDRSKSLQANARLAGSKSTKFPKGGGAFERWCADRGIHTLDKRPIEEWNELLEEFASRPVHGLRRGCDGGDHRPNPRTRR